MTAAIGAAVRSKAADTAGAADVRRFRDVLGHFCTGIVVVTSVDEESRRPVGFACQSFAALSLDPPLVLFCPAKTSRTWPVIARTGRFAVNVLTHAQQRISARFGGSAPDKFADLDWRPGALGMPVLADVAAWLECAVEDVHEAGDHFVVVGRVSGLDAAGAERPLLFHRGRYTVTAPDSPAAPFPAWPPADAWL
ncbi:3-hydroxy-9,10-secoandrosta-1,3,5(10)-triene-9,17-dione monooxygenase reductase subunit [Embleya sp. MST-111070]|uniref:3-hydroxy-9,10-secoandrosta-1,3,5(10)-triene-9, 17-dione monooxygenase reductase subunit n=1 Tax=Embleya sp. MST-111070 TaxID=3398231 RepID=UPI003F73C6AE